MATLDLDELQRHLKVCEQNRSAQEYHVLKLREQLAAAENNLKEWDGAIKSAQILIEQTQAKETPPSDGTVGKPVEPDAEPDA